MVERAGKRQTGFEAAEADRILVRVLKTVAYGADGVGKVAMRPDFEEQVMAGTAGEVLRLAAWKRHEVWGRRVEGDRVLMLVVYYDPDRWESVDESLRRSGLA